MAEAIAKKLVGSSVCVQSAGINTEDGLPPTNQAVLVMKELGYDISKHSSQAIEKLDLSSFNLFITMTPAIGKALECMGIEPSKIVVLNIRDPYGKGIEAYRSTLKDLEVKLRSVLFQQTECQLKT